MKICPEDLTRRERHQLMGDLIVPRPIAFVSTISADGILNLAPFSMSNIVGYHPATVFFTASLFHGLGHLGRADGSMKDTRVNIQETGEFVMNMVTEDIARQMNVASAVYPPEEDEFKITGLTPVAGDVVKAPRVKESPVNLECRVIDIIPIGKPDITAEMILGKVLQVHVRDDLWRQGTIDASQYHVIGRMGWGLYCRTQELFEIEHPQKLPPR